MSVSGLSARPPAMPLLNRPSFFSGTTREILLEKLDDRAFQLHKQMNTNNIIDIVDPYRISDQSKQEYIGSNADKIHHILKKEFGDAFEEIMYSATAECQGYKYVKELRLKKSGRSSSNADLSTLRPDVKIGSPRADWGRMLLSELTWAVEGYNSAVKTWDPVKAEGYFKNDWTVDYKNFLAQNGGDEADAKTRADANDRASRANYFDNWGNRGNIKAILAQLMPSYKMSGPIVTENADGTLRLNAVTLMDTASGDTMLSFAGNKAHAPLNKVA